jgi:hypothetical protein
VATTSQPPISSNPPSIALDVVRNRLAGVWIGGSLLIFSLVIYQSLAHVYAERVQDVWEWLMPTLLPTLTMIVSVAASTAFMSSTSTGVLRKSFYRLALSLSIFYLVLIFFTIVSLPAFNRLVSAQIDSLHTSNLWIGPIQGIVASALGVLFASKMKSAPSDSDQ